ncbi:hypothetical protein DA89_3645 [Vibrio cholerae]|nr:hypothetical protein DA89_3645 [Vibrio cholerae]
MVTVGVFEFGLCVASPLGGRYVHGGSNEHWYLYLR